MREYFSDEARMNENNSGGELNELYLFHQLRSAITSVFSSTSSRRPRILL
jgi:hypothetical protein